MPPDRAPTLHQLLAFYIEAGVDCALAEEPVNRLVDDLAAEPRGPERAPAPIPGPRPAPAPLKPPPAHVAPRGDTVVPPEVAIAAAREAARSAPSLEALRELMENFEGCALKSTAMRLVFADGNPRSNIMFVGEAPGRDEDIEGLPFVGRSGKLLNLMMAAIGLDRSTAYIANIIPWRPPGNRDPSLQETQICLPFIRRHIELVDPDILVCLGKPSSQAVLDLKDGIMKTRGKWVDYRTGVRTIRAMPIFHPAYLLRQPSYKRLAWQDLRAIRTGLAAANQSAQG